LTKFVISNRFIKDVKGLSKNERDKLGKTLDLLEKNPDHPSLKIEKLTGTENIWSVRLSIHYRMTFIKKEKDTFILRRIGTHQIYKRP